MNDRVSPWTSARPLRWTAVISLTTGILLTTTFGCELVAARGVAGDPSTPAAGSSGEVSPLGASVDGAEADETRVDPASLSAAAAHPALARGLRRAWLRGFDPEEENVLFWPRLGETAHTSAAPVTLYAYAAERAATSLAPMLLAQYGARSSATALSRLGGLEGPEDLSRMRAAVRELTVTAPREAAASPPATLSPDQAADAVSETLARLSRALDDVEKASRSPREVDPTAALLVFGDLLERRGVSDREAVTQVADALEGAAQLLRTGRRPRAVRVVRRPVHPMLLRFLSDSYDAFGVAVFSELLGLDFGDTLRGRNVEVNLVSANLAVHEILPRLLDACGAVGDAATLRAWPSLRAERDLEMLFERVVAMQDPSRPEASCVGDSLRQIDALSELGEAFTNKRSGINQEPYYARAALARMAYVIQRIVGPDASKETVLTAASSVISPVIRKLRTMPRQPRVDRLD